MSNQRYFKKEYDPPEYYNTAFEVGDEVTLNTDKSYQSLRHNRTYLVTDVASGSYGQLIRVNGPTNNLFKSSSFTLLSRKQEKLVFESKVDTNSVDNDRVKNAAKENGFDMYRVVASYYDDYFAGLDAAITSAKQLIENGDEDNVAIYEVKHIFQSKKSVEQLV